MPTTFQRPVNNFSTTLASAHVSGSGTLALATGAGTLLGALGTSEVFRVTVYSGTAPTETILGVFEATGRTGDQLTGVTAVEGYTDSAIAAAAKVEVRATAKTFSDIYTAIQNLEVVTETAITGAVTLDATAFGKSYVCSGTAADYTVTLPTAAAKTGQTIAFRMSTALTRFVTLDGSGSETINGLSGLVVHHGETVVLMSDGTNWAIIGGRAIPLVCKLRLPHATTFGAVQSINGSAETKVLFTQAQIDNSTRMADLANNRILIHRTGTYRVVVAAPWDTVPANIVRIAASVKKIVTGTPAGVGAEGSALSGGFPIIQGSAPIALTAGDNLFVDVFHNHGSAVSLYGDINGTAPILSAEEVPAW